MRTERASVAAKNVAIRAVRPDPSLGKKRVAQDDNKSHRKIDTFNLHGISI
jgi:hypothetical protein